MNTQNWRLQMQEAITSHEDLLKHASLNNYQKDWLQENFSKNSLPFFLTGPWWQFAQNHDFGSLCALKRLGF